MPFRAGRMHGVAQPLPGAQPELKLPAGRPALLLPKQIGRVLDLRLGGLVNWRTRIHAPTLASPHRPDSALVGFRCAGLAQDMRRPRQTLRRSPRADLADWSGDPR